MRAHHDWLHAVGVTVGTSTIWNVYSPVISAESFLKIYTGMPFVKIAMVFAEGEL